MTDTAVKVGIVPLDHANEFLYVSLDITTTSVVPTTFSKYNAFPRTFASAPKVYGVSSSRAGALCSAEVGTAGITLSITGITSFALADGTTTVRCLVHGPLA